MKATYSFAHGLRQLTRDTKSDVSCSQTYFTRRNEKLRMTFGGVRHITLKNVIKTRFSKYNRLDK